MNLAEMLYQRGWQPVTGEQFLSWYSQRWPSHRAKRGLRFVEKRVHFNHRGKGVFLVIAHRIEGKLHHVNWVDESGALAGAKLELAFSPALLSGLAEGPGTHVDID